VLLKNMEGKLSRSVVLLGRLRDLDGDEKKDAKAVIAMHHIALHETIDDNFKGVVYPSPLASLSYGAEKALHEWFRERRNYFAHSFEVPSRKGPGYNIWPGLTEKYPVVLECVQNLRRDLDAAMADENRRVENPAVSEFQAVQKWVEQSAEDANPPSSNQDYQEGDSNRSTLVASPEGGPEDLEEDPEPKSSRLLKPFRRLYFRSKGFRKGCNKFVKPSKRSRRLSIGSRGIGIAGISS
jgi:hypothetical protein